MQFISRNIGTSIMYGSELCLNDDYDITSIPCDNIFGTNVETQEVTLNDTFVIPLEEYLVPKGSKDHD